MIYSKENMIYNTMILEKGNIVKKYIFLDT